MAVQESLISLTNMPLWAVLLAVTLGAFLVYFYTACVNNFSRRHGQPGPLPFPIMGHFFTIMKKGMIQSHLDWIEKYGKVVGLSHGSTRAMLVADPELLREIMSKQFHHFVNRQTFNSGSVFDNHLLNLKDERWKDVRSIMSPTFTSGKLRVVAQLVNQATETFLHNLSKIYENDQEFEAKEVFSNFTIDVITATTCGIKVDSQTNPEDPFVMHIKKAMDLDFKDPLLLLMVLYPKYASQFLTISEWLGKNTFRTHVGYFLPLIEQLSRDRKENGENGKYKDFLQLLMKANQNFEDQQKKVGDTAKTKGMSQEEITANILLFFMAGYDTTSQVLQFVSYLLAIHPEWQDKVIEEIDEKLQGGTCIRCKEIGGTSGSVYNRAKSKFNQPNHDNVQTLDVMEMCYCEAMRMYPPGWMVDRICSDDVTVNGVFFGKGTEVTIPCWQIHHDPQYYPDPEVFNPERFTAEAKQARKPYTYLPFGMGPRNCIGMRLAQMELKMLLTSILQKYKFIPCERTQVPLVIDKNQPIKPTNGVWLKVVAR